MTDTAYLERANGRFEMWTYSDGARHYVWTGASLMTAYAWARRHNYKVVRV